MSLMAKALFQLDNPSATTKSTVHFDLINSWYDPYQANESLIYHTISHKQQWVALIMASADLLFDQLAIYEAFCKSLLILKPNDKGWLQA